MGCHAGSPCNRSIHLYALTLRSRIAISTVVCRSPIEPVDAVSSVRAVSSTRITVTADAAAAAVVQLLLTAFHTAQYVMVRDCTPPMIVAVVPPLVRFRSVPESWYWTWTLFWSTKVRCWPRRG